MAVPTIFAKMASLGLSAAYKLRPTKLKRGLRTVSITPPLRPRQERVVRPC